MFFSREKNNLSRIFDSIAFYYNDFETAETFFSKKARDFFSVAENTKFTELINVVDENDFVVLETRISELEPAKSITQEIWNKNHTKCIECRINTYNGLSGKIKGFVIIFNDVTENAHSLKKIKDEFSSNFNLTKTFSDMVNHSDIAMWKRDEDLKISYFNIAYGDITGKDSSGEVFEEAKSLAKKAKISGKPEKTDARIVLNNVRHFFEIVEIPVKDSGTIGYALDISKQQELDKELQMYIAAQSDILESSASAMAVFSPDTRIRFYNNAYINFWKFDEKWLAKGPTIGEILENLREKRKLPEQYNFPAFKAEQLKNFNRPDSHEEFFYLPDGKTLRVVYIPHALGGLLISYEDITDRLALERSFNTLVAVKKTTLDNLYEGVCFFGEDARLKLFNQSFKNIWQLDESYLEGNPSISEVFEKIKSNFSDDESWENVKTEVISYSSERKSISKKFTLKGGNIFSLNTVPLPDGATLITLDDITDSFLVEKSLRERTEALEQAENLKNKFLANISYELRSPLTSIRGFTEMMLSEKYSGDLNKKQKEYMSAIFSSSTDLMNLINGIIDISSLEAGYTKFEMREFPITSMITTLVGEVESRLKDSKTELIISHSQNIGNMYGDEERIKQAIVSIINSFITMPHPAKFINVVFDSKGKSEITINIFDKSLLLEKEVKDKINLKATSKAAENQADSTGSLGFSIAKSLIELHGGKFDVISEPATGTKVSFVLKRTKNLLALEL